MTASALSHCGAWAEPTVSRHPPGRRVSSRTIAEVRITAPDAAARLGGIAPSPPVSVVNTGGGAAADAACGSPPWPVSWLGTCCRCDDSRCPTMTSGVAGSRPPAASWPAPASQAPRVAPAPRAGAVPRAGAGGSREVTATLSERNRGAAAARAGRDAAEERLNEAVNHFRAQPAADPLGHGGIAGVAGGRPGLGGKLGVLPSPGQPFGG